MKPDETSIYITGASQGLGAALALAYARPGVFLALCARNASLLGSIASQCEARGARVFAQSADITVPQSIEAWATAARHVRPPAIVYANAGLFTGTTAGGALETAEKARLLLRTNIEGALNTAYAVLPFLLEQKAGRIVFTSSLAALQPLADAPAYSASKAAVTAYGTALRDYLRPHRIGVSVVMPGHIGTRQTRHHIGLKPFELPAGAAAAIIQRQVAKGRDVIVFPRRLAWLIRAGQLLPLSWRAAVNAPFRFHIADDE